MEKQRLKHIELLSFLVLAVLVLFWGNQSVVLWNQDEAAYAGFGARMLETGQWLIPDFYWSDVHRKPPLHFWLIGGSYLLFGINEFAVRFSSSLSIIGTFLIIYFMGRKLWSHQVALTSCFVLLSSILVPAVGKIAVTDATLLLFQTWSALSVLLLMKTGHVQWVFQFWIALALGMLTKGPSIILFAGLMGLLVLLLHPNRNRVWKLRPWVFFPIAALPLFIWGYLAWQTDDGDFINWLVDWYILRRIGGNVFGQTGPPGYYLAIFGISFLAWLPFLILAIWKSLASLFKREFTGWAVWLIAGWVVFEFLSSKLPAYTLAAHPAIAIGIAHSWHRHMRKRIPFVNRGYIILLALCCAALVYILYGQLPGIPEMVMLPLLSLVAGICITVLCFAVVLYISNRDAIKTLLLYVALIPNFLIWFFIIPGFQNVLDGHVEIADELQGRFGGRTFPAYIGNDIAKPPSLPFYVGQAGGEISMEKEPSKLIDQYNREGRGAFILSQTQFAAFRQSLPGLQAKEFTCFLIDRQKMVSYFVVLKDF